MQHGIVLFALSRKAQLKMPITPYHFGPSGFIGLAFRKWLDIPVFVLANVIVDIEVLFYAEWPVHRHAHTLLIGAVVGALWGAAAYPLRPLFGKLMHAFRLSYQTSLRKMIISGILGAWFHVLIDGTYHWDVHMFWPHRSTWLWRTVAPHLGKNQIKDICVAFFLAAVVVYAFAIAPKSDRTNKSRDVRYRRSEDRAN